MRILINTIVGFATGYLFGWLMTKIPWTAFIILPTIFAYLWLLIEVMQQPKYFLDDNTKQKYQARWDKKPELYKKIIIKFEELIRSKKGD